VPEREQLGLAARVELAAAARVVLGGRPSSITAAIGLLQRPGRQPGALGALDVDPRMAAVLGSVEAARAAARSTARPLGEQEILGHGTGSAGGRAALLGFVLADGDQLAPAARRAVRRPGAVEGAALAALDQADDPGGEVAHVDELQRLVVAQVGHQHLAAFERAPRPVAEAPAAVARADDQAGTNDESVLSEHLLHLGLAGRLLRPVMGEVAVGGSDLREVGERVDLPDR
jgi:hypothetical protein